MLIRRAVYYWQFAAAILLPLWLFVGWGIWGSNGWTFLGLAVLAPILFIAMLLVTLIIYGRPEVRRDNAVSWIDVGLLLFWHAMMIGFGFFGPTASLFAVLGIVAGLTAFWGTLWELVRDTAKRAKKAMSDLEDIASGASASARPAPRLRFRNQEDVVIIHETPGQERRRS